MASRGSIPKVMATAGIEMLPPAVGVPASGASWNAARAAKSSSRARSACCSTSHARERPSRRAAPAGHRGHHHGQPAGLEIRTPLDPARQAFLDDHRIDGTPVLPGVMGMEAFAEAAALLARATP